VDSPEWLDRVVFPPPPCTPADLVAMLQNAPTSMLGAFGEDHEGTDLPHKPVV